ncbi:MAG: MmcB family DNA repair protein [Hyphomicrobiaceae bacterium]
MTDRKVALPHEDFRQAGSKTQDVELADPEAARIAATLADGRQSEAALCIQRGVCRLLRVHAMAPLTELALANGRRADVAALSASGDIWIVEIKSSVADFQADFKWPEYRDYCDRFFFAVAADFPSDLIPTDAGLIIADRYGGEIIRDGPTHRLAAPRRRALTTSFARAAALRLASAIDPKI